MSSRLAWSNSSKPSRATLLIPCLQKRKEERKRKTESILNEALSLKTFAITLKVGKLGMASHACNPLTIGQLKQAGHKL